MKTIMVVDDEEDLMEALKVIFAEESIKVIPAFSGSECLSLLKKEKPDLILMDIMMPYMSGVETVERIRENPDTKDLKIAFLTVRGLPETGAKNVKRLHVLDYISKPFDNYDLVQRVKKLMG